MHIQNISYLSAPILAKRPPYYQSVATLKSIFNDPAFWQYLGNHSIQSIELPINQYDKNMITITTNDGRKITIQVEPLWSSPWKDYCDFKLEYQGEKAEEENVHTRPEIFELITGLETNPKAYSILEVLRANDAWEVVTMNNR
jgi:hypothetical protein